VSDGRDDFIDDVDDLPPEVVYEVIGAPGLKKPASMPVSYQWSRLPYNGWRSRPASTDRTSRFSRLPRAVAVMDLQAETPGLELQRGDQDFAVAVRDVRGGGLLYYCSNSGSGLVSRSRMPCFVLRSTWRR
jgi:hypothetical protein